MVFFAGVIRSETFEQRRRRGQLDGRYLISLFFLYYQYRYLVYRPKILVYSSATVLYRYVKSSKARCQQEKLASRIRIDIMRTPANSDP
jgi:hypothetical protein